VLQNYNLWHTRASGWYTSCVAAASHFIWALFLDPLHALQCDNINPGTLPN